MIKAEFFRNENGHIHGFEVINHGDPVVCSAVSALTLNVINSIDALTDEDFKVDNFDDKKGLITFNMPEIEQGKFSDKADLLLESYFLGMKAIEESYGKHLRITDKGGAE